MDMVFSIAAIVFLLVGSLYSLKKDSEKEIKDFIRKMDKDYPKPKEF